MIDIIEELITKYIEDHKLSTSAIDDAKAKGAIEALEVLIHWDSLEDEETTVSHDITDTYCYEDGLKCVLWGKSVKDMNREELITFIGFFDQLIYDIRSGRAE